VEVYLREHGWVPVDPPDVRKVVLEEPPGNRPLSDEIVSRAQDYLFGSWEMNWMAYNYAHNVDLPGSASKPLVYFMYPQAETSEGRIDPFDPRTEMLRWSESEKADGEYCRSAQSSCRVVYRD
jgi:transglutaminase-like putative cysteine protease